MRWERAWRSSWPERDLGAQQGGVGVVLGPGETHDSLEAGLFQGRRAGPQSQWIRSPVEAFRG